MTIVSMVTLLLSLLVLLSFLLPSISTSVTAPVPVPVTAGFVEWLELSGGKTAIKVADLGSKKTVTNPTAANKAKAKAKAKAGYTVPKKLSVGFM